MGYVNMLFPMLKLVVFAGKNPRAGMCSADIVLFFPFQRSHYGKLSVPSFRISIKLCILHHSTRILFNVINRIPYLLVVDQSSIFYPVYLTKSFV